ncbi:MAG: ankyrin repeat domain-containing protein [Rickettsiales bacterium]|nr:ankyrin repeat domain-containing protein [Rickettsiales bacterium]
MLLKYGANPAANSNSALECAFYRGYNEIIELLLQYRADPNAILGWACQSGDVEVVKLLLKYGADPKRKVDGKSPVEFLGDRNRIEIIKLLAQYSGVEKHYLRNLAIEAVVCCCLAAGFAALGVMYSSWCFVPAVICAVFACLPIAGAIKAAFFTEKKEPSPEFAGVITKEVVNNAGLNVEGQFSKKQERISLTHDCMNIVI